MQLNFPHRPEKETAAIWFGKSRHGLGAWLNGNTGLGARILDNLPQVAGRYQQLPTLTCADWLLGCLTEGFNRFGWE